MGDSVATQMLQQKHARSLEPTTHLLETERSEKPSFRPTGDGRGERSEISTGDAIHLKRDKVGSVEVIAVTWQLSQQ